MILIVGNDRDPHIRSVIDQINNIKNNSYILLNIYSQETSGVIKSISDNFELAIGDSKLPITDISAVWWRQKAKFEVPTDSEGLYDYSFVQREWNTVFDFIGEKVKGCLEINDRRRNRLVENKAIQLEIIKDFEFNVPRTIITNNANKVYKYFDKRNISRCIYKTFSPYMPPNLKMAYTTELNLDEILQQEYFETIDVTPGIFQELIEPAFELRVTVVGEEIFGAKITSKPNNIDWRISQFQNTYSRYELCNTFKKELLKLHSKFDIVYGAYDFLVDKKGDLYFLEVNPSGQWMWLEEQVSLPISSALAELLMAAKYS